MKIIRTRRKQVNTKKGKIIFLTFLLAILVTTYYFIQMNEVKEVSALKQNFEETVSNKKYVLGGELTGIKLLSEGVLVVGVENHNIDLVIGDVILEVDGKKISSNAELVREINRDINIQDKKVVLKVKRKEEIKNITVYPKYSDILKIYELGLFVKDSSAGVGTITVYEKTENMFCGLGHAITESSENVIVKITTGAIVKSEIDSITKSEAKKPGDIRGKIYRDVLGNIIFNTKNGIYGVLQDEEYMNKIYSKQEVKLKGKNEIKEKTAYLLCSLDGEAPKQYEIKIQKVLLNSTTNKNMVIKITDKELIEKTGGIVQGMSGSPIIQDGYLIGAVTHVFLNDPTSGYAVFIENMIYDMENIK